MSCTRSNSRSSRGRVIKTPSCACGCQSPNKLKSPVRQIQRKSGDSGKKKHQLVVKLTPVKILQTRKHVQRAKSSPGTTGQNRNVTKTPTTKRPVNEKKRDCNQRKAHGNIQPLGNKLLQPMVILTPIKNLQPKRHVQHVESSFELTRPKQKLNARKIPVYNQFVEKKQPQIQRPLGIKNKLPVVALTPIKTLRTKKPVQYLESSLETTQVEQKLNKKKKIPIYNQCIKEKKQLKRKDDYEFDSDSEQRKKGKKGRNTSALNDTSLEIFLNKAVKKKKKVVLPKKKNQVKQALPTKSNICPVVVKNNNKNDIEVDDHDIDPYISDEDHVDSTTPDNTKSPKVKILSNIQLTPGNELWLNMASPTYTGGRPNANSTMVNNVLTPWRFNDINIKRNPHFISYKQSSLPRIEQEMVLDHTIVDKLKASTKEYKENVPATPQNKSIVNKRPKQVTINECFGSNTENKENENQCRVSLFDDHQFSPIKSGNGTPYVTERVKRKILGEMNENTVGTSSPHPQEAVSKITIIENDNELNVDRENQFHAGNANEIDTNFGFDSDEVAPVENAPSKPKTAKPFRLSVNANDKKYQRKRKIQFQKKVEVVTYSDDESSTSDSSDEVEQGQYKLFEDFNTTAEYFENQVKRKRKFNAEYRDLQKAKRRKDVMSKEEEAEAEKWAAAFNSMCEEVEQFPLEIE